MSMISNLGATLRARITPRIVLGAIVLAIGASAPADAEGPGFSQGLKPPAYKYYSQYESMSGFYLNLGNGAYARVPTIRLRVGAVKAREVEAANVRSVGHFMPSVGHFQVGSGNAEPRIVLPVRPRYSYKRYGYGRYSYGRYGYGRYGDGGLGYMPPFYGQPSYGPGYGQLGYGNYGFDSGVAIQRAPQQPAYVGSFNAPRSVVATPQPVRPDFKPRFVHFNGTTVKSGNLPTVHKPAGRHFIRVE